jgi:hypothetical protein
MGAMVSGELEQGEFVQLRFSLSSSSHVLELRARVCHQRGYYCGFEFLVVSDTQREPFSPTWCRVARRPISTASRSVCPVRCRSAKIRVNQALTSRETS